MSIEDFTIEVSSNLLSFSILGAPVHVRYRFTHGDKGAQFVFRLSVVLRIEWTTPRPVSDLPEILVEVHRRDRLIFDAATTEHLRQKLQLL